MWRTTCKLFYKSFLHRMGKIFTLSSPKGLLSIYSTSTMTVFCRLNIYWPDSCKNGFDASVSQLNSFLSVQKDGYYITKHSFSAISSDALVHFASLSYSWVPRLKQLLKGICLSLSFSLFVSLKHFRDSVWAPKNPTCLLYQLGLMAVVLLCNGRGYLWVLCSGVQSSVWLGKDQLVRKTLGKL